MLQETEPIHDEYIKLKQAVASKNSAPLEEVECGHFVRFKENLTIEKANV